MTAILRNPVAGSVIPRRLRCVDFESGGNACSGAFAKSPLGVRFSCPNRKAANGRCDDKAFCYPRKQRRMKRTGVVAPHYHQGIDLMATTGTEIVSVSDGVVVHVELEEVKDATYGKAVGVRSQLPGGEWVIFYYTHCDDTSFVKVGDRVRQQQRIATVGHTGTATKKSPHLHFEVIRTPADEHRRQAIPTEVPILETVIGETGPRLDPVRVLEELGPWGMSAVYLPTSTKEGPDKKPKSFTPEAAIGAHKDVERDVGGYYPLGANNTWHGGVHLNLRPPGQMLIAPFDATIVAVRLDAEADSASGMYGSTNFMLLRHELGEEVANLLGGKSPGDADDDPASGGKGKGKAKVPHGVGLGATNPVQDVVAVKLGLHAHGDESGRPFYAPPDPASLTSGVPDDALFDAIKAFQGTLPRPKKMKKSHPWPDGVVSKGGYTWSAIFGGSKQKAPAAEAEVGDTTEPAEPEGGDTPEPQKPAEPPDPKRTLYCLLMHLGAASVEAVAKTADWLGTARVAPRPGNDDEVLLVASRAERADDEAEGEERKLKGRVGFPVGDPEEHAGDPEELRWVQKRLIRFGFYGGDADGAWSERVREAIAAFQAAYVDYYATSSEAAPGYITPGGDTARALRKPKWKLDGEAPSGAVDPLFAARLGERAGSGRAVVVSGLSIPVRAGENLWPGGHLITVIDGGPTKRNQLHFEFFSEHPLTDWQVLIDETNDLVVDLPDVFFDAVEVVPGFAKDRRLEADEIRAFYASKGSAFLRRTLAKFRSEWDLDIPAWVKRLDDLGFEVDGIGDALESHMFWTEATDVLPSSSHVWHYNPIEFLSRYAELVKVLEPRPAAPRTSCTLAVRVRFADGQVWSGARVVLSMFGSADVAASADVHGLVVFDDLAAGEGIVWLDEHVPAAAFVDVDPGDTFLDADLEAPIAGPRVATGILVVYVRTVGDAPAVGVEVALRSDGPGVEPGMTDGTGVATFPALPPGNYAAWVRGAVSPGVELLASATAEVVVRLDVGSIDVQIRFANGSPAAGHEVLAEGEDGGSATATSDANGIASFEVVAGTYDVWVHGVPEAWETVEVTPEATTPVALLIPLADTPTNAVDRGGIDVFVRDELGAPRAGELVWLLDDANLQLASETTAADGRTRFDDLDEGTYGISAEHGLADELGIAVTAGKRAQIAVRVGAPKPASKPTGTLLVTVAYEDGAEFDGTLKVTRANYSSLVSRRVTGSFVRVEDIEAGPIVVFVDGFDREVRLDLPPNVDVPVILMLPGFP